MCMMTNTFLLGSESDSESDTVLLEALSVVPDVFDKEQHHTQKWFAYGMALGLSVLQLYDIETRYNTPAEYVRESILLWRQRNKAASLEPILAALKKIHYDAVASKLEFCDNRSLIPQAGECAILRITTKYRKHSIDDVQASFIKAITV